ncbi:glycosyltransferase family 2 protein [Halarchaeum sp. CBA1220]|uniref:glycosyltransferase family 2 protein n=1 Tax=Halarchaeum sp. CBA1220 TaxID=1853682 RepID=UPI002104553E|nr:glycosyltransferase family 2 protein [Halarchaeum sp. CBA1220]
MPDHPPVSVVVPYSEEYTPAWMFEEATASVDSQSVETELVVVGGEDGPAAARNEGLERATHRHVAFLDADDTWHAEKLGRQLDAMADAGVGLCVEGDPRTMDDFVHDVFVGDLTTLMSSVLVDTARVTATFDRDLSRGEDLLYVLEAATEAGVCLRPDLTTHRDHAGSVTGRGIDAEAYLTQSKRFGYRVSERVPDAQPYLPTYYTQVYADVGRAYAAAGESARAREYFLRALRITPHPYALLGFLRTYLPL